MGGYTLLNKAYIYVLGTLVLTRWISNVAGTVCYDCDNIPYSSPISSCQHTTTCPSNQICFSASYINDTRKIFHRLGCTDEKNCDNDAAHIAGLIGKRDVKICKRCCLGDKCNTHPCKDIHVGICYDWNPWNPCSTTCGLGKQTRLRICQRDNRDETDIDTKPCILRLCPGPGNCVDATPTCSEAAVNKTVCGFQTIALSTCPRTCGLCPAVDGLWSEWSRWTACSVSCGTTGHMARMRSCNNPAPKNNGTDCVGNATEQKACRSPCQVNGGWSTWSDFSKCSVSCGGGMNLRTRKCDSPAPSNGGNACNGSALEYHPCKQAYCPVDGQWAQWSHWQPCSVSCGNGTTYRVRVCSNPVPSFGGKPCASPQSYADMKSCWAGNCIGTQSTSSPVVTSHQTHSTTVKTTMQTTHMTPSTVPTSTHLSPVIGCYDKDFCTDAHLLPVVCDDAYMSNNYCPKLCGICGASSHAQPCEDTVGHSCHDPSYAHFVCSSHDLSSLCSKTCGLCH